MSATRSPPTLPFQSDSAYINKLIHSDTPEQTEKQWQELEKNGRKIKKCYGGNIIPNDKVPARYTSPCHHPEPVYAKPIRNPLKGIEGHIKISGTYTYGKHTLLERNTSPHTACSATANTTFQ